MPSLSIQSPPSSPSALHHSHTLAVISVCHPPLKALRPQPYRIFSLHQPIVAVFSLHHPSLAFDFRPPTSSLSIQSLPSFSEVIPSSAY
ncbi:uncharacterized protein E5676_scaffold93G00220 [Cucumis melo var. makuwa]|uniref:Uncharacterized protein n=1 Tax=Cucumis melo var. makuwa TaxID=1194695 RepID=A0A5D3DWP0_CUCMM|nr:uncharacterized protein E5676_scaffold93G00220 [Cucumis melo var. makuwa]